MKTNIFHQSLFNLSKVRFNFTKLFILYSMLITEALSCPFQNYEQALLTEEKQFELLNFDQLDQTYELFEFGFWSLCTPYWLAKYPVNVENEFDQSKLSDGQLFFLLKGEKIQILCYLNIDVNVKLIQHTFIFFQTDQAQKMKFNFSSDNYEDDWIFTFLRIDNKNQLITVEITGHVEQSLSLFDFQNINQLYLGGQGNINELNLSYFKGRLSKAIILKNEKNKEINFTYLSQLCKIPPLLEGEQKFYLIKGLQFFDGILIFNKHFQEFGKDFYFSGWIKYDFSNVRIDGVQFLLNIGVTQNSINYNDETNIFSLSSRLFYSSKIAWYMISANFHQLPLIGYGTKKSLGFPVQLCNYLCYERMQEWHFIRFQHRLESQQNQIGQELQEFSQYYQGRIFINTMYYCQIGGEEQVRKLFQGSIYDLQFSYNIREQQEFQFVDCHYSCLNCNGPFKNNCLSCNKDNKRDFIKDTQSCECVFGFIETGVSKCENSIQYFPTILQHEQIDNQKMLNNCNFGYFKYPIDEHQFQCVECPQQIKNGFQCVDCLFNPESWYLKPICTTDFSIKQFQEGNEVVETKRNNKDYDLYFINEGELIMHIGLENFCNFPSTSGCYQSDQKHLDQYPFVQCKQNYYWDGKKCQFVHMYCTKVSELGICIETVEGKYFQDGKFFDCPIGSTNCFYSMTNEKLTSVKCFENYSLIDDQCYKCGDNCKVCQNFYDTQLDYSYLRCFRCINDSQYFISFDAQNCLYNYIKHCVHAFQAIIGDFKQNTLDLYFKPRYDVQNIKTYCGRCDKTYVAVLKDEVCLQNYQLNCIFSYSDELVDCEVGKQYVQLIDLDTKQNYCVTQFFCIIDYAYAIQYVRYCSDDFQNCESCLLGKSQKQNSIVCIVCLDGYYSERLSNKCRLCPTEFNCLKCTQQLILNSDQWKQQIRAFYKQFIDKEDEHPFNLYGQSSNIEDYEIVCSTCKIGFELYENQCIKPCPSSCSECKIINYKNVCIKCQTNRKGKTLTISNNECIECPENCEICRKRSEDEIKKINPLFNNQNYVSSSNQCLKSFSDKKYYYDPQLNNFISCESQSECQQEFKLQMNLICSKNQYTEKQSEILNEGDQRTFRQSNILIEDLISGNSFKEFENDYFYYIANQKIIKIISITITSDQDQTCVIGGDAYIQQQFSHNIFSAINIQLELIFKKNMIFKIEGSLTISNFTKILISGLDLQFIPNDNIKKLVFSSAFVHSIYLKNIQISQEQQQVDSMSIRFENIQVLFIEDFLISNLKLNNVNQFLEVTETVQKKQIQITNLRITQCIFQDQKVLLLNLNQDDEIKMSNLNLDCSFFNSILLTVNSNYDSGKLYLNNSVLIINADNSTGIFALEKFAFIQIYDMILKKSSLNNSTFIILNTKAEFDSLLFEKNYLEFNASLIQNLQDYNSSTPSFNFHDVQFISNQYSYTCKFINILRQKKTQNMIMKLEKINISNNFNYLLESNLNIQDSQACLLYLEVDFILMNNLSIQRGYGLKEISIIEPKQVHLSFINIIQGEQFSFKGLHRYLDCQLQQVKGIYYLQSFYIFAAMELIVENLTIKNVQGYNTPIFQYVSAFLVDKNQFERVSFKNLAIENNFLISTTQDSQSSLISITSQQDTTILIQNSFFINNLQNSYLQSNQQQTALLLNFDCNKGTVQILDSYFYSNSIFNSTDNIININSEELRLLNCLFKSNGIFNYTIIQPYLIYGYQEKGKVYVEDLESIFQIKSTSGNGFFKIEKLNITNCTISVSQGQNGGGFNIITQKDSIIRIKNVKFIQITNIFINEIENGGCLNIDNSQAYSLELFLTHVEAKNIYSHHQGGILYLISQSEKLIIQIEEIEIQDVYSEIGSLFYIDCQNQNAIQTNFLLNQLSAFYTQVGLSMFLDKFYNLALTQVEQQTISTQMKLIYLENIFIVDIQNIQIESLILQAFLGVVDAVHLRLNSCRIYNCQLANNLIDITPKKYIPNQIQIENLRIETIRFGTTFIDFKCQLPLNFVYNSNFICIRNNIENKSPLILHYRLLNKDQNFGKCFLLNLVASFNQPAMNLIKFQSLNISSINLHKIHLKDIDCSKCQNGLLYFFYPYQQITNQSQINNLYILNSSCGNIGCINIFHSSIIAQRILAEVQDQFFDVSDFEFIIERFMCFNNTGNLGTCVYVENVKTLISESQFISNIAHQYGGAIYVNGEKQLCLINNIIQDNEAQVGGGVYLNNQGFYNFTRTQTIIHNNKASFYGNELYTYPCKLNLAFGSDKNYLNTDTISEGPDHQIDQINVKSFKEIEGSFQNWIIFPSGQKLSQYQLFDWKKRSYISYGKKLRLVTIIGENDLIKNLSNTVCSIKSRVYNSSLEIQSEFTNNYTNMKQVVFNESTEDYNIDDLIVYFNSKFSKEMYLQLEFNCSVVQIPVYNQKFPYDILKYHSNYTLRLNLRTFPCQLGEILKIDDFSCLPCDSSQNLFSLNLNSLECSKKDDVSTISVQGALLNLKQGFWRPYIDSSIVSFCLNLEMNCQGGWIEGDSSCYMGHIGALCEQCDLYNIRGDGQFSVSDKYQCGSCQEKNKNIIIVIGVSFWTLISIFISVQSAGQSIENSIQMKLARQILKKFYLNEGQSQSGILIKLFNNYFQIIGWITSFQLEFPNQLNTIFNSIGFPIKTVVYSLDCFLADLFSFEIQYSRMIWHLILPFFYIIIFSLLCFIGAKLKIINIDLIYVGTTLIYMYVYLQPSLIGSLVELISYHEVSGFQWIIANVAYRFDTQKNLKWILYFSLPILIVLALVIPVVLIFQLVKYKNELHKPEIRKKIGYLYGEYKVQTYYWEIVKILKKEFIIIFLIFYDDNLVIKSSIILIILSIYFELIRFNQPYFLRYLNNLDLNCNIVIIISFVLAIGISNSTQQHQQFIQLIQFIILILINIYQISIMISQIIIRLVSENISKLDQKLDRIKNIIQKKFPFFKQIRFFQELFEARVEKRLKQKLRFEILRKFLLTQAKQKLRTNQIRKSQMQNRKLLIMAKEEAKVR